MYALSEEFSLYWLAAAISFSIGFGALKMAVAVSKIMKDDEGKFEFVTFSEGLYPLFQDKARRKSFQASIGSRDLRRIFELAI